MARKKGLRYDIPAKFEHMTRNLGHKPGDPMQWDFWLRGRYATLESVAPTLKGYQIDLQKFLDEVHCKEVNGRMVRRHVKGRPLLVASITGALSQREVMARAAKFERLARKHRLTWGGVSCYDPIDWDELLAWMDLEGARWRLRHHTDAGTRRNAKMPFTFAMKLPKVKRRGRSAGDSVLSGPLAAALKDSKMGDNDGVLLAQFPGRNNEKELAARYRKVEKAAAASGAELLGVQFFELEDAES